MAASANAIFLSYSAQDEEAARRICSALRAAGLDVWFDQSELRGGDAWDASIRQQIKDCALFVPLISASTESRGEGYFRLEWRLAVERSYLMADDQAFLLPVVIDSTPEATARVPDRFRERQWSRLPGGEATPDFVDQVRRALSAVPRMLPATAARPGMQPAAAAARRWQVPTIVAAAVVAILAALLVARSVRQPSRPPRMASAPSSSVAQSPKSIAVLPFQNLTGRPEDAYLADGLQEETLNALARLGDLKVISRTSTSEFHGGTSNVREIGLRLGVGSILEGSIRRDGNAMRLTVQLIDARDDRHLLATNYDRDLGHILGLQSAVARTVAAALSATLSAQERGELDRVATNNGDAYDLYLRAAALWRQPTPDDEIGVIRSMPLLERALRLDPEFSDANAMLSQAHTWKYFGTHHAEDASNAKRYYERALALDPQLPEAIMARGLYQLYVTRNLDQALADIQLVVRMRPNSASAQSIIGFVLRRRGRFDEALVHMHRAWDLDPLNRAYDGGPITTLLALRRYPEAIEETKLDLTRFPDSPDPYFARARIEGFMQHSAQPLRSAWQQHASALQEKGANETIQAEIARGEGRYLDAIRLWAAALPEQPIDRQERLGFLYWAAGRKSEADRTFRELERMGESLLKSEPDRHGVREGLAMAQSMLGEHAKALATIDAERARDPENIDPVNGPHLSFIRSIVLVRAGRTAEGYAEVARLAHVPFAAPTDFFWDLDPALLAVKDDSHFDILIKNPPRL